MIKKSNLRKVAKIAACLAVVVMFFGCGGYQNKVEHWEYRMEYFDHACWQGFFPTDQLNVLGGEGWELVSVSASGSNQYDKVFTFKRRLP